MSNTTTSIELTTTGVETRESPSTTTEMEPKPMERGTTAIIFATVTGVTGISSLMSGMVTVVLPKMAKDLDLSDSLLLWYVSKNGHLHI